MSKTDVGLKLDLTNIKIVLPQTRYDEVLDYKPQSYVGTTRGFVYPQHRGNASVDIIVKDDVTAAASQISFSLDKLKIALSVSNVKRRASKIPHVYNGDAETAWCGLESPDVEVMHFRDDVPPHRGFCARCRAAYRRRPGAGR